MFHNDKKGGKGNLIKSVSIERVPVWISPISLLDVGKFGYKKDGRV